MANSTVEIYSDSLNQGRLYEATVLTDAEGHFTWDGTPTGPVVTAIVRDEDNNTSVFSEPVALNPSSVDENQHRLARRFAVYPNYPNPFNPSTMIVYDVAEPCDVRLSVYNMLGKTVYSADLGLQNMGQHQVAWHGIDESGVRVSSGIYFYQIKMTSSDAKTVHFQQIRKMILLK